MQFDNRVWRRSRRKHRATQRKGNEPYDRDQSIRDFLNRWEEEYLSSDQYRDIEHDYLSGLLDFRSARKIA